MKKPGERFGTLIPYYYTIINGKVFWNCVCDCGHDKLVSSKNLKGRIIRHCDYCKG